MRNVTFAVLGFAALGAVATASTAASAMPISPPAAPSSNAEQVGYACNTWGRCWWGRTTTDPIDTDIGITTTMIMTTGRAIIDAHTATMERLASTAVMMMTDIAVGATTGDTGRHENPLA